MNLFYATCLLFSMVLLELLAIRYVLKENIPWNEIISNLNAGHILFWVFRGFELMAFQYVLQHFSVQWVAAWPVVGQWVFAFLVWDLCFYWLHYTHHKISFLWNIHAVHHEGEHFSLSLGIRNAWFSSLTQFPFFVGLAILGVPLEIYLVVSSVHYFIQFYNHSRVGLKKNWLDAVFVTPHHHRIHHAMNPEYLDKNCGGTFVFWDKIFGTYQSEIEGVEVKLGIHAPVGLDNPFWANILPLFRYLGLSGLLAHGRARKAYRFNDFFVAIGGFLLFGLLLLYIYQEPFWPAGKLAIFFTFVFVGTIANGGLVEGKPWGVWLWVFTAIGFNAGLIPVLELRDPLQMGLLVLFALHGGLVLFAALSRKRGWPSFGLVKLDSR